MFCSKCQNDLSECTCSDIEERMNKLKSASSFTYKMCGNCNKHYKLCRCETPVWIYSNNNLNRGSNGKD